MGTHHIALFPNEQFLDLRPYQYGWEECAPLHSFGPFVRNHYLLHSIISGRGMLYSHASNGDIHEYSLKGGQGFLICPGQINLYTADAKEPWKYVWVEFAGCGRRTVCYRRGWTRITPSIIPGPQRRGICSRSRCSIFPNTPPGLPAFGREAVPVSGRFD